MSAGDLNKNNALTEFLRLYRKTQTMLKNLSKKLFPINHGGKSMSVGIEIDPKNTNALSGVKTVKNSDGSETTYNRNL